MPRISTGRSVFGDSINFSKHSLVMALPTQPKLEGYWDIMKYRKLFYKGVPGLDTK